MRRRQPARPRLAREYMIVLLAGAALYGVSVAPGVLWQDSGMMQVRILRDDLVGELGLALAHPLYCLCGMILQRLPLLEPALKTNLVSALFGALTLANVYLLIRWLTTERWTAIIGTGSLAVAHTFWQNAVMAEVYTVSTALLVGEFLCFTRYTQTHRARWLVLLFALNGLGVSNHMLAVLNLPVWGVILLAEAVRRKIGPGIVLAAGAGWTLGAALYLGLCVRELLHGETLWAVVQSALWGNIYAENVLNIHLTPRLLTNTVFAFGLNFPTPLVLVAPLAILVSRGSPLRAPAATIPVLFIIHLVWAMRYDVPDQHTFFIPAFVLFAVLIGIGADLVPQRYRHVHPGFLIGFALLPVLIYAALPWLSTRASLPLGLNREVPYRDEYHYFLWPWKFGYRGAEKFARAVQETLPEHTLLIGDSTTMPPLHYQRLTGRWQKDNRFWPPVPGLEPPPRTDWPTAAQVAEYLDSGRLYVVSKVQKYRPEWMTHEFEFEAVGIIYRVRRAPAP